ncbi:hypothetical protein C0995_008010 [Termitomyces sp. Mi166|nr:hypothetical protein C0995_008010 [Termitomyces sp. Mi166\
MPQETEPEIIDLTGLSESESEEEDEELDSEESSEECSSDDISEVPVSATSREQLLDAIGELGEDRLRRVLSDLVDTIPEVEERLTRQLLTLKRKTQDVIYRWETCINCNEEFDMTTRREEEECSFHPGELEVDEEQFADWDESCHGPMDSSHNRREYPENFKWTCCEGNGRAEGCTKMDLVSTNSARFTVLAEKLKLFGTMSVTTPKIQTTSISNKSSTMLHHSHIPNQNGIPYESSSDDDMDDVLTPSYSTLLRLRASIASTPEAKLREVLIRLVDRNPGFQLAIAQELFTSASLALKRTSALPCRKRRRSGRRSLDVRPIERACEKCGKHISDDAIAELCRYHPGKLPTFADNVAFLGCLPFCLSVCTLSGEHTKYTP